MLLPNKASVILLVKARLLEIYIKGLDQPHKIEFPEAVVKNLELVDQTKLNEIIISFIAQVRLAKETAVILLSDEVVFEKQITRDTPEKEQQLIDNFLDKIPLDKNHLMRKITPQGDSIFVFGANKNLLEAIRQSFENNGWHIKAIVPEAIFGKLNLLDPEVFEKIISASQLL